MASPGAIGSPAITNKQADLGDLETGSELAGSSLNTALTLRAHHDLASHHRPRVRRTENRVA